MPLLLTPWDVCREGDFAVKNLARRVLDGDRDRGGSVFSGKGQLSIFLSVNVLDFALPLTSSGTITTLERSSSVPIVVLLVVSVLAEGWGADELDLNGAV